MVNHENFDRDKERIDEEMHLGNYISSITGTDIILSTNKERDFIARDNASYNIIYIFKIIILFPKKKTRFQRIDKGYKMEYRNISDTPRVRKALITQIDATITAKWHDIAECNVILEATVPFCHRIPICNRRIVHFA